MLLKQGAIKFGAPDAGVVAAVNNITFIDKLEALALRLMSPCYLSEFLAS